MKIVARGFAVLAAVLFLSSLALTYYCIWTPGTQTPQSDTAAMNFFLAVCATVAGCALSEEAERATSKSWRG